MIKLYDGRIMHYARKGRGAEIFYKVERLSPEGSRLPPAQEAYATKVVWVAGDKCTIELERDGRWKVHPPRVIVAPIAQAAQAAQALPDYSHCTEPAYFPEGIPVGKAVDPAWEQSTKPAGDTFEGYCPLDPNFPPLVDTIPDYSHCTEPDYFPEGIPDGYVIPDSWIPSVAPDGATYSAPCPLDPNLPLLVPDPGWPDGIGLPPPVVFPGPDGTTYEASYSFCGWSAGGQTGWYGENGVLRAPDSDNPGTHFIVSSLGAIEGYQPSVADVRFLTIDDVRVQRRLGTVYSWIRKDSEGVIIDSGSSGGCEGMVVPSIGTVLSIY